MRIHSAILRCLQRILNRKGQDEYAGSISDRRDGWAMASSSTAAAQAALATRWGGRDGVAARCLWRQVLNGVLYVTKTGCQWRQLPASFGRWSTIYGYFNRWAQEGIWQQIPRRALSTTRAPTPKDGPRRLRRAVSIVNRLRRLTNQDPRVSTRVNRSTVGNDLAWSIL